MPKRSKENKDSKPRRNSKPQTPKKNTKKPLKTAICLQQNAIRNFCIRVKRAFGRKNDKKVLINSLSQDSEMSSNTEDKIVTIVDSSDEEDHEQNSTKDSRQAEPLIEAPVAVYAEVNNNNAEATSSNVDLGRNEIHGFIGVEYVVKINDNDNCGKTRYECVLCELNLGFVDMQKHLLDRSHRLKFCEQHFTAAIQLLHQSLVDVPADKQYKVMTPVLQQLAEAIEKHHGRSQPFECTQKRFQEERDWVLSKVNLRFHASEHNGPTFITVVDSKEVKKLISEYDYIKTQDKIIEAPIFDTVTSYIPVKELKFNTQTPKGFLLKVGNEMSTHFQISQPYHINVPLTESQPCSSIPHNLHSSSDFLQASQDIWHYYCQLVDCELNRLNQLFKQYKANPSSYPAYICAWQKFCHAHTALGKDDRTHHYATDWSLYFNNLLEDQFEKAFESFKLQVREKLSLPLTNNLNLKSKYHVNAKLIEKENSATIVASSTIVSSEPLKEANSIDLTETDDVSVVERKTSTSTSGTALEFQLNATKSFISILGLLAAFEELLGSLGPKVVDLLTKALRAEKLGIRDMLDLINQENCSLLETCIEKFKGLIIVGILDSSKEQALKKAIKKVTEFLEAAHKIQ